MNKYGLLDSAPKRHKYSLIQVLMAILAILGGCAFWFVMLWFGTKG